MKKISQLIATATLAFVVGNQAHAAELAGVQFPDTVVLAGQTRSLNGLGLRLATFFKVKVYVAGLYVAKKSTDASALLMDADSKLMRLSFLRDLDAAKLSDAFAEGFEKACKGGECKDYASAVKSFTALQPEVRRGEVLDFEFHPSEVILKKGDKVLGHVNSVGFSQILLRIWIGENPPNSELKTGLLGTK
ncbi:MAG: chalcone isomerase family protein [Bdellovibrionota bacterium]